MGISQGHQEGYLGEICMVSWHQSRSNINKKNKSSICLNSVVHVAFINILMLWYYEHCDYAYDQFLTMDKI